MAFATLAAAERLLVLGEPVGALLVVSYEQQQFISHMWILVPLFYDPKLEKQTKQTNKKHPNLPLAALLSQQAVWRAVTANKSTIFILR